jgi:hypothetical protein
VTETATGSVDPRVGEMQTIMPGLTEKLGSRSDEAAHGIGVRVGRARNRDGPAGQEIDDCVRVFELGFGVHFVRRTRASHRRVVFTAGDHFSAHFWPLPHRYHRD